MFKQAGRWRLFIFGSAALYVEEAPTMFRELSNDSVKKLENL